MTGRPSQPPRIRSSLLAWFDQAKRDLPWRNTRDPYRIWLSEMMLQQTQVATVIPYYRRFLRRFPTVRALAASSLDDVLTLWAGLGYYARARNLHRAAQSVVADFDGRFPDTIEKLQLLPGIGRYTAGAIASIAFDRRAPVVDGNVARVLARVFNLRADMRTPGGRERLWRLAESLLPESRCGDFNQALMELGATVCLPGRAAQCDECPLKRDCRALAGGVVDRLPVQSARTVVRKETHVVAAIERGGRYLFIRRPPNGLWGGLWELPSTVTEKRSSAAAAAKLARIHTGAPCKASRKPFCTLKHQLTHRTIAFLCYFCRSSASRRPPSSAARWLSLDEADTLAISQAMRRVIANLRDVTGLAHTPAVYCSPRRRSI